MDHLKLLTAAGTALHFQASPTGWCRLVLSAEEKDRDLGAEDCSVLARKLLAWLERPPGAAPSTETKPGQWIWILSLSELHSSFYVRPSAEGYFLRIEDDRGRLIAELRLGTAEAASWASQLKHWLAE